MHAPLTAAEAEVAGVRWEPIGDLAGLAVRAEVPQVVALAVAEVARHSASGAER